MVSRIVRAKISMAIGLAMILCALILQSCADQDLKKIANQLVVTGKAIKAMQATTLSAQKNGLISEDETRAVLTFTLKINAAGKQASDITRKIEKLAPEDRKNLGQILNPLLTEIVNARGQIQPIKNETTRAALLASLTAIETSLNIVRLSLQGS
jgi:hypothetical protein